MTSEDRVILPDYIKPKIYHLSFEPDLEKFTFAGEQTVEYEWKRATKQIKMNAKSLQVHSCTVTLNSGKVLNATNISYDSHDEYVIFDFDQEITESGVISVKWDGELNDKMVGFYRSEYKVGGESRYMATTQFEPTDARRAFPCWDEPAVKAQFAVTLIVPEDRIALSNMNIVSETPVPEKKKKVVKYAPTPIMSTYLLAFVVGEFDYIESHTPAGLPIRVYTQKGKTEQGKFGLDVAVRVIPLYEQYFGEKYPLPKLDLIAIPDFSAGAMENWGLVTYRETALLVDPVNSSTSSKQWVALVVCHECAHMWFGNLVTMEFWNGLWLNEGFATWVEYWAVDNLFPDWKIFEQFVHDDFGRAQQLDALVSSHPIEVDIKRAQEVDEIFDAISYSKGCAVIRMLVEWLGLETFRQGLLVYLTRHKFANATSDDLWRALGEAAKKDVKTMMTTWTRQTGYPVVTITEVSSQGSKRVLAVEQSRYLDSGKVEDNTLWQIPLSYITSANTTTPQTVMLTEKRQTIEVDGNVEWIKFNPNQTGFYRVMYPKSDYSKLVPAIENLSLPPIDRLGVLEDTCALAKSGYLSTDNALAILGSYKNEDNYTVWTTVSSNLAGIYSIIKQDPTISANFKKYAVSIFKGIGQKLGWEKQENESHLQTLLRTLVLSNLAKYGDEETNKIARQKFEEYLKNPNSLMADLRTTVYASVIRNGGKKEYDQVLEIFRTSDLNEEKNRCLRALGSTQDFELLKQTFDFSFSKEVRSQDMFYVLMTAADNVKGIDLAWQFLQDRLQELSTKFEGGFIIGRVIKICIEGLVTEEKAKEVEKFFEANKIENAQRSIAQGVETIRLNASWLNRDKKVIAEWLEKHA